MSKTSMMKAALEAWVDGVVQWCVRVEAIGLEYSTPLTRDEATEAINAELTASNGSVHDATKAVRERALRGVR